MQLWELKETSVEGHSIVSGDGKLGVGPQS